MDSPLQTQSKNPNSIIGPIFVVPNAAELDDEVDYEQIESAKKFPARFAPISDSNTVRQLDISSSEFEKLI